jgi:hypothetical protein
LKCFFYPCIILPKPKSKPENNNTKMSEYVLDVVNDMLRPPPPYDCASNAVKMYIKIDNHGNVEIKQQGISICSGHPNQYCQINDVLIINDNIPIPDYIIEILKVLLPSTGCQYTKLYIEHYQNVISCIKILKEQLKKNVRNPENEKDVLLKLKYSTTKNEMLEKELREMENKIKNIQTSYFDMLKDNEKLKEENKSLHEEVVLLRDKNKLLVEKKYNKYENKIIDRSMNYSYHNERTPPKTLHNCWTNPGGATIYTTERAANKMVYNDETGIYEPGYEL